MTIHEFGHFVAAIMVHAKDVVMYHNYVANNNNELSVTKKIIISSAGPMVSFGIGFLFHFICSKLKVRNMFFLFNVYMSAFGYISFFGYLMIAPIFTYGDTGYICAALHFPMWLTIAVALLGMIMLYIVVCKLVKYFVETASQETMIIIELRHPFINSLILVPLLIGITVTTLLNMPIPTFASLIAPLCSPFALMWAYGNALNKNYSTVKMNKDVMPIDRLDYRWIMVLVFIVILNRLLVAGIAL